jgi:Fungal Zn(2)-Cys(6) binuclear cluster domain
METISYQRDGIQLPVSANPGPVSSTSTSAQHPTNQNANASTQNFSAGGPTPISNQSPTSSTPHRIRRRNRMITSCLECRRRKLKCDKSHPCTNCAKFVRDCVFLAPALDSVSQLKLTEIKEKMGVLERGLEAEVANAKKQQQSDQSPPTPGHGNARRVHHARKGSLDLPGELSNEEDEQDGVGNVPEDEKNLEPTPLAVVDAAYDDDADDDMLDLGVKMGKMRYVSSRVREQRDNPNLV